MDEEEGGEEKQSLKVQGQFFRITKGKQFALHSGKHTFFMASPEREVCDEWISTLSTTLGILYQKSPLFSQEFLRIYLMDGTFTTMPLTENTKVRDVLRCASPPQATVHGLGARLCRAWEPARAC